MLRGLLFGLALLTGCASSYVSVITWESTEQDRVSLAAATDGANWYFYGNGIIRYKRISKETLETVINKDFQVEAAGGFRLSVGISGDVHLTKISKAEAKQMLKLYRVIRGDEIEIVEHQ